MDKIIKNGDKIIKDEIRKLMKGEYDGEESYGKGILLWGEGSILRRSLILVDFG